MEAVFALGEDLEWTEDASCRGLDSELFFAEKPKQTEQAKQICAGCPVRVPCLVDALERGERYGIWGGLDSDERERLLSRRTA